MGDRMMTRTQQTVHVVMKDIRMLRWMLGAYALLIGWWTIQWLVAPSSFAVLAWLAGLTFGAILTGMAVQADSPYRSDGFWAGQPFDALAVFGAKIVFAGLVAGGALAGWLVVALAHQPTASELTRFVGRSALSWGVMLGLSAMIAAVTPDLRTFLLVGVIGFAARNIGGLVPRMAGLEGFAPDATLMAGLSVAALLASVTILAHVYRTRRQRQGIGLALLPFFMILPASMGSATLERPEPAASEVAAARRAVIEVVDAVLDREQVTVFLRVSGEDPGLGYSLFGATVHLVAADGASIDLDGISRPTLLNVPNVALGPGIEWTPAGQLRLQRPLAMGIDFDLTPEQRASLAAGITDARIDGRIEVLEPATGVSIPFETGASGGSDGRRIRITDIRETRYETVARVLVSTVGTDRFERHPVGSPLPEFLLVDVARSEIGRLDARSATGANPGTGISYSDLELSTPQPPLVGSTTRPSHQPWSHRAQLVAIDWPAIGSYPVSLTVSPGSIRIVE